MIEGRQFFVQFGFGRADCSGGRGGPFVLGGRPIGSEGEAEAERGDDK
jgi:hypothetical protein